MMLSTAFTHFLLPILVSNIVLSVLLYPLLLRLQQQLQHAPKDLEPEPLLPSPPLSSQTASAQWPAPFLRPLLAPLRQRILLLIAHPDDEAMFFAPTLLALTQPALGNRVRILCLSDGNADGLGETRKKELVKSGLMLGVRNEEDIVVIQDENLPDSMTAQWSPQRVSDILFAATTAAAAGAAAEAGATDRLPTAAQIRERMLQNASAEQQRLHQQHLHIDILVTFDRHGVSSHPNHCAVHAGARVFLDTLKQQRKALHGAHAGGSDGGGGGDAAVAVYTLTSVGLARKYISALDLWPTVMQAMVKKTVAVAMQMKEKKKTLRQGSSAAAAAATAAPSSPQPMLLLASSPAQIRQAQGAMTRAHQSQMVWFRWGWILFSRYMAVNDLRLLEDDEQ